MPKTSEPRHPRPWPLIVIVALIVLTVGSLATWKLYHNSQVNADKQRFAQAERDVKELSQKIIAATGQPAKVETQKYCSRPNMKLEKGPLSCDVHWYGYYEVNTPEEATGLYQSLKRISLNKWNSLIYKNLDDQGSDQFRKLDSEQDNYMPNGDFLRISGEVTLFNSMKCNQWNGFYLSTVPPYDNFFSDANTSYTLAVEVSCGDYAKIEHYPMKS